MKYIHLNPGDGIGGDPLVKVYRMKDKAYALDTYNDLADIIARATEDHDRMKAAMLKKGFLPESDDKESEEENVFAVE